MKKKKFLRLYWIRKSWTSIPDRPFLVAEAELHPEDTVVVLTEHGTPCHKILASVTELIRHYDTDAEDISLELKIASETALL